MSFNFDEFVDRRGTYSWEYDQSDEIAAMYGQPPMPKDYISLVTADMDLRCSPAIKEAMHRVADTNLYGYVCLHPSVVPEYYEAIINWNKRRHNWEVRPEEIFYTRGVLRGVSAAIRAFTKPKDHILITPPVYGPFFKIVQGAGRTLVESRLEETDGYYTINWEDLEAKAADPALTAFVLCSPHNPTGRVWTEEELLRMYEICTRNGVVIIADEIHGDLVRKNVTFHPLSKLVGGKNVVTCTGPNKSFNLASLSASHLIVQDPALRPKIVEQLEETQEPTPFVLNAVIAAYNESEEWLDELRDYLDGNIDSAIAFLKEHMPKAKVYRPEGTYLLWVNLSGYGLSDEEIMDRCYKAAVFIEGGNDFDRVINDSHGWVRIRTSTQRDRLMEALKRISSQFE